MSVNARRSHLSEFGIIIAKGIGRIDELLKLAEVDTTLPDAAKTAVKVLAAILEGIEKAIGDLEGQIADAHARSDMNRLRPSASLPETIQRAHCHNDQQRG